MDSVLGRAITTAVQAQDANAGQGMGFQIEKDVITIETASRQHAVVRGLRVTSMGLQNHVITRSHAKHSSMIMRTAKTAMTVKLERCAMGQNE